jgi:hypothetical protein
VADYDGAFDLAVSLDAVSSMPAINERLRFGGPIVTDAFRFWFANPQVDYGYALRLAAGSSQGTKFDSAERLLGEHGPVLTLTYALPGDAGEEPFFHRGDPDSTGSIDLTDAVYLFDFLFHGGPVPSCLEAADAQNDGALDLSDGVYIFLYLFVGGSAPAAPGPTTVPCGTDPDPPGAAGDLGCVAYDSC